MIRRLTSMPVLACLTVAGCDVNTAGKKAEAESNAVSGITEVTQFDAMFPNSDHFISHYTGRKGDSLWNSKAGVHGRYVVVLTFKIDFDPSRTKPKRISPPLFYLREISRIESKPDGTFDATYRSNQIEFGIDEWTRLRESGGDLSVLGIRAVVDQPLKNFDEVWPRS